LIVQRSEQRDEAAPAPSQSSKARVDSASSSPDESDTSLTFLACYQQQLTGQVSAVRISVGRERVGLALYDSGPIVKAVPSWSCASTLGVKPGMAILSIGSITIADMEADAAKDIIYSKLRDHNQGLPTRPLNRRSAVNDGLTGAQVVELSEDLKRSRWARYGFDERHGTIQNSK